MNKHLVNFKYWYESRPLREKLLVILLGWTFFYALYSLILLNPVQNKENILSKEIKTIQEQIQTTQIQIDALHQIPNTPLYKSWLSHQEAMQKLQNKYKVILQEAPSTQWQAFLNVILEPQNNITLVEVKNFPETIYNPIITPESTNKIYQQKLQVTIYSNYIDAVSYMQYLEKRLPNIHWDQLSYQVVKYPVGKIQMGFSIYYEKK